MFRIAAARLLPRRSISTTAPAFVRIRSSNPSNPASESPAAPASSDHQRVSPAERPPPAQANSSSRPVPFEPTVSSPADDLPQPPLSQVSETTDTPDIPLEQPSPTDIPASSSKVASQAAEVDDIPDKPDLSKLPSLDIDPDVALPEPKAEGEGEGKKERTGAGRKEYVSSIEMQRRAYLRFLLGASLVAGLGGAWYLGRADPAAAPEGETVSSGTHWSRLQKNVGEMFDVFSKPAFKVLLPDPLPPPHQRPYTLVIDLESLLVSSTWDRTSGWRTAKRPGVDYFLAYLSQFYEIVLFTSQPLYTAAPVAEKLDPFGAYIPYKLFRESTSTHNGKVVKDLAYLNRDLTKVILLDTNAEHAALQPDNSVIIPPWQGRPGDKGLVDLIPFLESIAMFNVKDVRPILKVYQGKDIAIEYAKKEAESKRKFIEDWERTHPQGAGSASGWLSSAFGSVSAPGKTRSNVPMTYLDQKREEAQKTYQLEQKYWKDNEEEFKRMVEEDKQRQMAEMKGSLMGFFAGGSKKPETDPAKAK